MFAYLILGIVLGIVVLGIGVSVSFWQHRRTNREAQAFVFTKEEQILNFRAQLAIACDHLRWLIEETRRSKVPSRIVSARSDLGLFLQDSNRAGYDVERIQYAFFERANALNCACFLFRRDEGGDNITFTIAPRAGDGEGEATERILPVDKLMG